MLRTTIFLALASALLACGSSPGEQTNDLIEQENEIFTVVCECAQELFEETTLECIEDNIDEPESVECLDAAYELNADASEAYLDCEATVLDSLQNCIEDADSCAEQASCLTQADDAEDLCPDLPDAVRDAVREC